MEKKMTKKEMFAQVIAMAQGEEVTVAMEEIVAFAEHEIELLNKKAGAKSKKESANDVKNAQLMEVITGVLLNAEKPLTVSEIMAESEELSELSNQKVSALMKKLFESGKVTKSTDKRKSVFSI